MLQRNESLLNPPCVKTQAFLILRIDHDLLRRKNHLPGIPQDTLMFPSGAVLKGGDHFPGFPPGQAVFADCRQQPILVAALQPSQLRP